MFGIRALGPCRVSQTHEGSSCVCLLYFSIDQISSFGIFVPLFSTAATAVAADGAVAAVVLFK